MLHTFVNVAKRKYVTWVSPFMMLLSGMLEELNDMELRITLQNIAQHSIVSLVDAIIQPDTLITLTMDPSGHKGSTDQLEGSCKNLIKRSIK
jgi:hypothetical protein